jgi:predicted NAD/FAD-binding protein
MRIAVVGSGIAGLGAAWLLHPEHEITLFEADDRVGGHTHTVTVQDPSGPLAVDTGFIVFNELTYPNFVRLLGRLGVASRPTAMSFSVRCDRTGIEYSGTSLNTLFAQRRNLVRLRFLGMIRDILRFNREAPRLLEGGDERETVGAFLARRRYGEAFVDQYLVPMGAAIWSAPPGTFLEFPVRFVVEFFRNHRLMSLSGRPVWRTVAGGSARYVDALIAPFRDRIRTHSPVLAIRRSPDAVRLKVGGQGELAFDHVVVACHADQALAALADPTDSEREVLAAFPYQRNDVVLHTDASILPRRPLAWAAWNYHVPAAPTDLVTVTYNMNRLQGLQTGETYCVTLNEDRMVRADRVVRRFVYEHPLFRAGRTMAQQRHRELVGVNRTSFCGAYWGYGFHEDGLASAMAVAEAFGSRL